MKDTEDNMTPTQATGYIAGVGFGFVRRHDKVFAILSALAGLGVILASLDFTIGSTRIVVSGGNGVFIGAAFLAVSVVLWYMFRTSRK